MQVRRSLALLCAISEAVAVTVAISAADVTATPPDVAPRILSHGGSGSEPVVLRENAHVARLPTAGNPRGELLLHLPGSGVLANDEMHQDFLDHAAGPDLGFHVIGLDYPNWPTVDRACRDFAEAAVDCYLAVRARRLWGGGSIAEANAGIPQFRALLEQLASPGAENTTDWQQYWNSTTFEPEWSKIVVSGHSQGSGMALLIGKKLGPVAGVVMLSGGTDDSGRAPWLVHNPDEDRTPVDRIHGFFHDADGMGKGGEILPRVGAVLGLQERGSSLVMESSESDCCAGSLLHTRDPAFGCPGPSLLNCPAHYASLDARFKSVWSYMLTRNFTAPAPPDPGIDGSTESGSARHWRLPWFVEALTLLLLGGAAATLL